MTKRLDQKLAEELAGKRILGAMVKSPSVWLKVSDQTGGGWIQLTAEGDCCSDAFIDAVHVYGMPTLTGETSEVNFPAKPTTQEVDELYCVELLSDSRDYVAILHRNSSNGYYGNFLSVNSRSVPPEDAVDGKCWYRDE